LVIKPGVKTIGITPLTLLTLYRIPLHPASENSMIKLDLYTRYGYMFKDKLGAGLIGNVRTQFSNGYDYSETPRKRVSGFLHPLF
jgi:hypothetical protein